MNDDSELNIIAALFKEGYVTKAFVYEQNFEERMDVIHVIAKRDRRSFEEQRIAAEKEEERKNKNPKANGRTWGKAIDYRKNKK